MTAPEQRDSFKLRQVAEGFGVDADRYDRTRPHYPPELTDAILAELKGRTVLDVGIGTGISARALQDAGCEILGVEPDERMAMVARAHGFPVEVAKFEDWDARGRTFDALISGQSWHWINPRSGAAQAARVLKPGGLITIFWNAGSPATEIAAQFGKVYQRIDTGLPFTPFASQSPAAAGYETFLTQATTGLAETGAFTPAGRWQFEWETRMTKDAWLDQVPTSGGHQQMASETLQELLDAMGAVIDAAGGEFSMHYSTVAAFAHRLADPA